MYLVAMREISIRMTIEFLQSQNKPISLVSICDHLQCSEATASRGVRNLIKSGELIRTGTPRSGYTYQLVKNNAKSA